MTDDRSRLATARSVIAELGRGGPRLVTFSRGLALGALVGAALAGTAMLDRRSRTRGQEPRPQAATDDGPGSDPPG